MTEKLAIWTNKKLLMAARILVTNEIIFPSICYISNCANLVPSTFFKARTMMQNFISTGNPSHIAQVQVVWASVALSQMEGGIKVFNSYSQASALLGKLVARGLSLGMEPWRCSYITRSTHFGRDLNSIGSRILLSFL